MVEDAFGSVATLSVVAWTITPRTVTARVNNSTSGGACSVQWIPQDRELVTAIQYSVLM